jgi:hypothetical protein
MTFQGPSLSPHQSTADGLFFAWRKVMLRLLMCLFGLHGAIEIDHTIDDEEIKVCRDCLKEIK